MMTDLEIVKRAKALQESINELGAGPPQKESINVEEDFVPCGPVNGSLLLVFAGLTALLMGLYTFRKVK